MKLVITLGGAVSLAVLTACSVTTEDENAQSVNANSTAEGSNSRAAGDDVASDTLGNQLNQLNESDSSLGNDASSQSNSD